MGWTPGASVCNTESPGLQSSSSCLKAQPGQEINTQGPSLSKHEPQPDCQTKTHQVRAAQLPESLSEGLGWRDSALLNVSPGCNLLSHLPLKRKDPPWTHDAQVEVPHHIHARLPDPTARLRPRPAHWFPGASSAGHYKRKSSSGPAGDPAQS